MKKHSFAVGIIILVLFSFVTYGIAADVVIEKKIENIVFKKDKNGQPYARIIVKDKGTLNGVSYDKSASVMAFGDQVASAKTLRKGQMLKAIAAEQSFRGSISYQLLKVLK